MNAEQQNIAIAEWMGIEDVKQREVLRGRILKSSLFGKVDGKLVECPDYSDLNALHEAWQKLDDGQRFEFRTIASLIANREHTWVEEAVANHGAEIFLRTIEKWRDSP